MTINLNIPICDFEGNPIPSSGTLGQLLANQIGSSAELTPAIKWLDWAISLWKGEIITVDQTDYDLIVKTVEGFKTLTVISRGQILKALRDGKQAA